MSNGTVTPTSLRYDDKRVTWLGELVGRALDSGHALHYGEHVARRDPARGNIITIDGSELHGGHYSAAACLLLLAHPSLLSSEAGR